MRTQLRSLTGLACVALTAGLLQGCANVLTPLGENTYDCNRKENPASPYCHSFQSVDAATRASLTPSRFDQAMSVAEHDKLTGIAPVPGKAEAGAGGTSNSPPSSNGALATPLPPLNAPPVIEGLPVRVGPVVQRIWVKRFVDRNDLLVSDTVIYKEIVGSHWLGFDQAGSHTGGSDSASAKYPHRPPQPASTSAGHALGAANRSPSSPSGAEPPAGGAPVNKGFRQPGAAEPASPEVVSTPTTGGTSSESAVMSMPN